MLCRESLIASDRFDQIPSVTIEVFEDSHDAIRFMARGLDEADTPLRVSEVVTGEGRDAHLVSSHHVEYVYDFRA
jgi:hypothetical protein